MTTAPPTSPKILQLRQLRTAIVILVAAGAFAGYYFYTKSASSDSSPANTKNDILALKEENGGNRAVLIQPDGKIVESPAEGTGVDDREAVWRPDGNRIFISRAVAGSKTPEETNYQLYRWNPSSNDCQRRTIGTRALAHPRFSPEDAKDPAAKALTTAGGRVLLFDPLEDSSIRQILPPATKEIDIQTNQADSGAAAGDFDQFYRGLGDSFREARWSADKTYIISVLRRDNGEALVVQKAQPQSEEERRPSLVICAQHIDFDVSAGSNTVLFSALDFQWQDENHIPDQYKLGGKVTRPYNHLLAVMDLDKIASKDPAALKILDVSKADGKAFAEPTLSLDGKAALVVEGTFKGGNEFSAEALFVYGTGGGSPQLVARGAISNPSWHPSGDRLLFARREANGERDIVMIAKASPGQEVSLTSGKGSFSHPKFSPQQDSAP